MKIAYKMLTEIVASSLPVFIDEFTRGEQPVITQFLFLFVGTLCFLKKLLHCKNWLLGLLNNTPYSQMADTREKTGA